MLGSGTIQKSQSSFLDHFDYWIAIKCMDDDSQSNSAADDSLLSLHNLNMCGL